MSKLILLLAFLSTGAQADESHFRLKDAPGKALVSTKCITCHSLDYISMNSNILNRQGWETEVGKMIKAMGADINANDAEAIVDYLSKNYGRSEAAH